MVEKFNFKFIFLCHIFPFHFSTHEMESANSSPRRSETHFSYRNVMVCWKVAIRRTTVNILGILNVIFQVLLLQTRRKKNSIYSIMKKLSSWVLGCGRNWSLFRDIPSLSQSSADLVWIVTFVFHVNSIYSHIANIKDNLIMDWVKLNLRWGSMWWCDEEKTFDKFNFRFFPCLWLRDISASIKWN